jgi:hypothetical protein
MRYLHRFVLLIIVPLALMASALACTLDQQENATTLKIQNFTIEPDKLLDSIAQGKPNVFTPVDTEPPVKPPSEQISVSWTQADYLYIAETLHEQVWGESLDGWQIRYMGFKLTCREADIGLQNGTFDYFKIVKTNNVESRLERFIDIDPRFDTAYVREAEYIPVLVEWKSIDQEKMTISADDALKIAEKNGGKEKRLSLENACNIDISIVPNSNTNNDWNIRYSKKGEGVVHEDVFTVNINMTTGEITFIGK